MIILICDDCHKKEDVDILDYATCDDCKEKEMLKENIEEIRIAIKDIYNNKLWEDWDSFVGFKNDDEKSSFMRGIKYGIESALFGIADHFGEIDFIESVLSKKDRVCKKSDDNNDNTRGNCTCWR